MRLILSILFILFMQFNCVSQFNIKVGYALGFTSASENNRILSAFNVDNSEILESDLSDLNSLHGIMIGARYKLGSNCFEFSWEHLSRKREGVGELNMVLFQQDLFYSFNQLMINYETSFGVLGVGTGIGMNKVKIKDRISSSEVKKTLVSQYQPVARFNLAFNFPGENLVRFSLKPFYQIALSDIDLVPLASELGVSNLEIKKEPFSYFGLAFIFYNGRQ